MEADGLDSFYRSVTFWPQTIAELVSVAQSLSCSFKIPLSALIMGDPSLGWRVGVKISGLDESISTTGVEEYIIKKIDSIIASKKEEIGFQHIALDPPGSAILCAGSSFKIANLSFVRVSGRDFSSQRAIAGEQPQLNYGWLVVGSAQPLGAKDRVLLIAAADRLAALGVIDELAQAVQIRNRFLSIASHELKTPLTSIYGILQLQDRMIRIKPEAAVVETKDQKKSYVKILLRQVERLNELIDGLLDVSRIQNGRFMVEPADTDVCALLRETVQGRLQVIAQDAGVKLSVEAPEKLKAWVDPVRWEEVVTNLVMNAIRFSPEGGVIWIRLKEDREGFRLTVRDQGPSVPLEDRERLFRPFERAQRTSRLGGLGLGLYISRQIALLHGGNVSLIESVPGKGNVMEAYFPSRNFSVISA